MILTILSISISAGQFAPSHGTRATSAQAPVVNSPTSKPPALVFITPSNVTNTTLTNGDKVTFGVYLNQSPPINFFSVSIEYNPKIMDVDNVNSTGNVLGSKASIAYYCVDGRSRVNANGPCLPNIDNPGVVTYSLTLQGGFSELFSLGFLFNVTFDIVGSGLAQLHMLSVVIGNGTLSGVHSTSMDSFFANGYCGGVICRPPRVNLTLATPFFATGRIGTLNATVVLRNPNDNVTDYTWFFGEVTATSQGITTTHVPWVQHIYQNAGQYIAGVQITDFYKVIWTVTVSVNVTRFYVALSASEPKVDPQQKVIPGTLVQISASINNLSTIPVNTTFSITVGNLYLKNSTLVTLAPAGGQANLNAVWNTTGYTPQAYAITVVIPILSIENTTAGNTASTYVILVTALPSGLSLSLLQTTGLGIVVLVAIGVVLSRFLKRPSYEDEPLSA
jgi:hypothetical protein